MAPFPPESALESILKIIPESIQEPSVQNLGDFAGQLGLILASIIAVLVYGVLGLVFQRFILPRIKIKQDSISIFEIFLIYSSVPYVLFGLILLPIFGSSLFGLSPIASGESIFLFPVSMLFVQLLFSLALFYGFRRASVIPASVTISKLIVREVVSPNNLIRAADKSVSRRTFLLRGVLFAGFLTLSIYSLDKIFSTLSGASSFFSQSTGSPINLESAPAIFRDPRLTPLVDGEVTPNGSFYRVAIDIIDPVIDGSTWSLQVDGSVNKPKNYSLSQLQASFEPVEQYNTFECVSNVINGTLISNAKWTGLRISDLLNDVGGASQGAEYVIFYSVDGYSVAIPLAKALMADSILAYKMNNETLPTAHGYPLRAVIPGLYGMMSAKFVNKIQLVNSPYQGYWQSRGWSSVGTVQTVSFIRVPTNGSSISLSQNNGTVILGGVAYAGDRGISKVEISVDDGRTWEKAQLKNPLSNLAWVLWAFEWSPTRTGQYNVYARATDGASDIQTSDQTNTFPNGATGYAMTSLTVVN